MIIHLQDLGLKLAKPKHLFYLQKGFSTSSQNDKGLGITRKKQNENLQSKLLRIKNDTKHKRNKI